MGRQDQGLVGRAAPTLAACLQGRTQPLQSTVPSLGQLQSERPCLPQWVRVDVRAAGCGWGWKLPCQSQQDWMELEALVLGAHPCAPGLTHSQCRKVHTTPAHGMSLLSLRSCARTGYGELGLLCPKQEPFRGGQEKLPGGKSPPGSGPQRSRCAARALAAAGATAAGVAASAGARHKGRLCSRSSGCLPRAILLAPGRLPAPAAHTWAFHEGSGDDLLPGGRGRAGGWSPSMPAPGPLCVLAAAGPRTCKQGRGSAQGIVSPNGAWGKFWERTSSSGTPLSNHGSHSLVVPQ